MSIIVKRVRRLTVENLNIRLRRYAINFLDNTKTFLQNNGDSKMSYRNKGDAVILEDFKLLFKDYPDTNIINEEQDINSVIAYLSPQFIDYDLTIAVTNLMKALK